MDIPICDLARQAERLMPELLPALERVLRSGAYVLGAEVRAFEAEIADYLGAGHAIGVASGTDALELSLRALGIGRGDRVLTTPFTFFATASAILRAGAEPVFADIDPATFNLAPARVAEALAGRSPALARRGIAPATIRALMPVHLYGAPAEVDALARVAREHGLPLIEDAAQAIGAEAAGRRVGTFGALGCFSFYPTKNLGACGDGGLVVAADAAVAERLRLLRSHGTRRRYVHDLVGDTARLDELQAALLRVKLRHLEDWIAARIEHAEAYAAGLRGLAGIALPEVAAKTRHAFHQYTLRVAGGRRDALQAHLAARGIGAIAYYPVPVHLQPALAHLGYAPGDFPAAEQAAAEVVSLPIFPELTAAERGRVIEAVAAFSA